jgi:hypothetical protein
MAAIGHLRRTTIHLDFVFPVAYAAAASSLFTRITGRLLERPTDGWTLVFFSLPFFAGLLDWLENSLLLAWVLVPERYAQVDLSTRDAEDIPASEAQLRMIRAAATIKYLLLGLPLLAILYWWLG